MYKLLMFCFIAVACKYKQVNGSLSATATTPAIADVRADSGIATIHIIVALCDNKYQGIIPVPAAIGNGQDPAHNLYWGCEFGIKSFFKKSSAWQMLKTTAQQTPILERVVFKHRKLPIYLVADAYDGQYIKQSTIDFLNSCAGKTKSVLQLDSKRIGVNGNADLLAYIGHNGLMDFRLSETFNKADSLKREAIILACKSKLFFAPLLQQTGAYPLLWTTGLMAPEAYTLHDMVDAWIKKRTHQQMATTAASSYARYQHCSPKAAQRLLVTGW
jgi:hypothetical protein